MTNQLDVLNKNRQMILKIIEPFTIDQLNKIPEGFSNNITWNVAHLVVTQQILCYKLSGLSMNVSDELVSKYMKGTLPKVIISENEFDEIKDLFISLPKKFEEDLEKGVFKSYQPYTTSLNVTLTDVKSAFDFNNFHEGIHLGVILALRKLV